MDRLLPSFNPPIHGLSADLSALGIELFTRLTMFGPWFEAALLMILAFAWFRSIRRQKIVDALKAIVISNQRYVIGLWIAIYLSALLFAKSRYHLDMIDARLIAPIAGPLFLLVGGICSNIDLPRSTIASAGILLTLVLIVGESMSIYGMSSNRNFMLYSTRMAWIASHTTSRDLIVGDDTMDIPFRLGPDRAVISFSPYPYTDRPDWLKLRQFFLNNRARYENIYFVLRKRRPARLEFYFGKFFTGLIENGAFADPEIRRIATLPDAVVYRVSFLKPGPEALRFGTPARKLKSNDEKGRSVADNGRQSVACKQGIFLTS
jgi:hypothetical protein